MATRKHLFCLAKWQDEFDPIRTRLSRFLQFKSRKARAESRRVIRWTARNLGSLAVAWLTLVALIAVFRIASSPTPPTGFEGYAQLAIPYWLVALAPVAGFMLGRAAFLGEARRRPSSMHFSQVGKWRSVSVREAMRHPSYGPIGFMASLIIGMLLNVMLRTAEFAMAIPALTTEAPPWGIALFWLVTLDVVIMNFFYAVCFVMALRSVPLFPKMLLFAWLMDILLQLGIAHRATSYELPSSVAVALQSLLTGNVQKVLISMMIWLPYLILAERVNVTYRHRIAR
ncbi:DUF2569 domain-containing protein [Erythrobacter sp. GH1-10]|uniref:DUF2569 domain-containing protein n=1 Tax=Erythrobacter sp. GH1-10 TaxID=3349334 RepID=UPI0038779669